MAAVAGDARHGGWRACSAHSAPSPSRYCSCSFAFARFGLCFFLFASVGQASASIIASVTGSFLTPLLTHVLMHTILF